MKRFILFVSIMLTIDASDTVFEKHLDDAAKCLGTSFRTELDACFSGDADACVRAGEEYSSKSYLIRTTKTDTLQTASYVARLYKQACKLGSARGCRKYAMIYAADTQKEKDKNARYYFKLACDQGDTEACTLIAMMPKDR